MSTYNSYDQGNNNSQVVYDFTDQRSKGLFLTKVFTKMFICLLITTVIAAAIGYGFQTLLIRAAADAELYESLVTTLVVILIVSAITLLIMSFVLPMMFYRGKHNIAIPLYIYVSLMGVLLSTFTFLVDWVILVEAFGITTLIFGTMGLLGYVSKGKMTGIGVILLGLLIGAGLLSLVNWIMILVRGYTGTTIMISWIVSLMIFAFLMFATMYDVYRIKQIAERGSNQDNNLVNYCAYILYSDFIAILVRVIYFLAIIFGKSKK